LSWARTPWRGRLAARIYLVSVGALLLAALAVMATVYLVWGGPPAPAPSTMAEAAAGLPPPFLPLVATLLGLALAAWILARAIARPLDRLARTARALGAGDLSARTGLAREDELGQVAKAFDEMADRVVALLHGQTELVATVAHELRTPLARIRVALDLAQDADARVAQEALSEIATDLVELEGLVTDILAAARLQLVGEGAAPGAPPLRLVRLEPGPVLEGAAERFRSRHPGRRLELLRDPALPQIDADAVLLRRALDNLLDNARKYSGPDQPVQLRVRAEGQTMEISVEDHGVGLSREELARLFTPFFRAERAGPPTSGVGLGLVLVRRIVEAHGGCLVAESQVGAGTNMVVRLPIPSTCAPGAGEIRATGAPER
jgi:signal transduction histidine kinase